MFWFPFRNMKAVKGQNGGWRSFPCCLNGKTDHCAKSFWNRTGPLLPELKTRSEELEYHPTTIRSRRNWPHSLLLHLWPPQKNQYEIQPHMRERYSVCPASFIRFVSPSQGYPNCCLLFRRGKTIVFKCLFFSFRVYLLAVRVSSLIPPSPFSISLKLISPDGRTLCAVITGTKSIDKTFAGMWHISQVSSFLTFSVRKRRRFEILPLVILT